MKHSHVDCHYLYAAISSHIGTEESQNLHINNGMHLYKWQWHSNIIVDCKSDQLQHTSNTSRCCIFVKSPARYSAMILLEGWYRRRTSGAHVVLTNWSISAGSTTPVDSATCTKNRVAMKWIKLASIGMYPTKMLSHQFCKSQHTGIAFVGSVTHLRHWAGHNLHALLYESSREVLAKCNQLSWTAWCSSACNSEILLCISFICLTYRLSNCYNCVL